MSRAWSAYAGKQVGGASTGANTGVLWSGTPASAIAMTPTGWSLSVLYDIDANRQVGTIRGVLSGNAFHAAIWSGSANNVVDINPAGYSVSVAYATDGTYQSGQATLISPNEVHAGLWRDTAGSFVDLHPPGFTASHIYGAEAGKQAGYGVLGGIEHALMWSGSAGSVVDLNGGFDTSRALGMDAYRVAGSASGLSTGGFNHAIAWDVATGQPTDLHSSIYTETTGWGVSGKWVVGYGSGPTTSNRPHAMIFVNGTVIDLHKLLPTSYGSSYAYGIDPISGTVVGEAVNNLNRSMAFMWVPVRGKTFPPR